MTPTSSQARSASADGELLPHRAAVREAIPCCAGGVSGSAHSVVTDVGFRASTTGVPPDDGRVTIHAGRFAMGDPFCEGDPADGETPVHQIDLSGFRIGATTVTNANFARFVAETGYRTEAEQLGMSAVFQLAIAAQPHDVLGLVRHAPAHQTATGCSTSPGMSGNGAPTGSVPATTNTPPSATRRGRRPALSGSCVAGRSCATTPIATGTASAPAHTNDPHAASANVGFRVAGAEAP